MEDLRSRLERLRTCDPRLFVQIHDARRYAANVVARCVQLVFYLFGLAGRRTQRVASYVVGRVGCSPFFAKVVASPQPRVYAVYPPGVGRVLLDVYSGRHGVEFAAPLYLAEAEGLAGQRGVECRVEESEALGVPVAVCRAL